MQDDGKRVLDPRRLDAVIFDMDGVVTDTASVHAAAWKDLFDGFLRSRGDTAEFGEADYRRYVDGKPRYDGVRGFLASRGITLPEGDPSDPPNRETVCGLGNRKNARFLDVLREQGAESYPSTVRLVRRLGRMGVATALISASRNVREVLVSAGLADLFAAKVDGVDAERLGLPGKPDPAVFLEAARKLGVAPARSAIVEDAIAGVEAGRRGAFGLVIGVDRTGHPGDLWQAGADVVVSDLSEVRVAESLTGLPSALEKVTDIVGASAGRRPVVFLDYDGTLTPIVDDPAKALLPAQTREAVRLLARRCTVAVVSGRDLDDVQAMVGVDGIAYAGSHGFDILRPDGMREQHGQDYLPALDRAEIALEAPLARIDGARLERKGFAIAVHFRQVAEGDVEAVERAVDTVAAGIAELRKTGGKKIFELRPDIDWDKGRALLRLLEVLDADREDVVPIYIGDDETDEDAFREVHDLGVGIVVGAEDRPTLAHYTLRDPDEARAFLETFAGRLGEVRA